MTHPENTAAGRDRLGRHTIYCEIQRGGVCNCLYGAAAPSEERASGMPEIAFTISRGAFQFVLKEDYDALKAHAAALAAQLEEARKAIADATAYAWTPENQREWEMLYEDVITKAEAPRKK